MNATDHDDLMDMSSRIAYDERLEKLPTVPVNGRDFEVVEVHTDTATGLDAIALRNPDTQEITVAFEGTDGAVDVMTDAVLLTTATPDQYTSAANYVDYVSTTYGPVGSVCGNSLGGGLAAYVGALNPGIEAVTVNPAPVPAEVAGKTNTNNIHNYITEYDILNRAVRAGGLEDRILGNTTRISGTTSWMGALPDNHIGSDRKDSPYDASMATPFSLFDGTQVIGAGGYGAKVAITVDNLMLIATGLDRQKTDLGTIVDKHLIETVRSLVTYRSDLDMREAAALTAVQEYMARPWDEISRAIDQFQAELRHATSEMIGSVPNSVPAPIRFVVNCFTEAISFGTNLLIDVVQAVVDISFSQVITAAWLLGQTEVRRESEILTDKLITQGKQMNADWHLVLRKWNTFARQVDHLSISLQEVDDDVAAAIADRTSSSYAVPVFNHSWPDGNVEELQDNTLQQFTQNYLTTRSAAAGVLAKALAMGIALAFESSLTGLHVAWVGIEASQLSVQTAGKVVRGAMHPGGLLGDLAADLLGLDDDIERIEQWTRDVESQFNTTWDQAQLELLQIKNALDGLPMLVLDMLPFFEEFIFSDSMIQSAYDSFAKCRNLVDRSAVSFGEVDHHLDGHSALAVDRLADRSAEIQDDLTTMSESFTEMIA